MKRNIAIFLLSVYLFSTTEARELLKLPVVFMHYQEHKVLNKDLTILEFLDIHYMHGSPHDDDYDRDMQLPFKTPIPSTVITLNFVPPLPFFFCMKKVLSVEKKQRLPYTNSRYSYHFHSSIWQPPRAC